ncbi:MAG: amidohydrolase, partial [Firmicutes bacterium]|nr:amidohydrolase [Bacillota bacterium]
MKKLFVNGNIITMNETIVNSVLIEDDLIIQVGNDIVDEEAEIIDLDGKTILPSFIDAHSHLTAFASSFLEANLENT